MKASVVTVASGRHDHLRAQLRGLAGSSHTPWQHVVVAMGDKQIAEPLHIQCAVAQGGIEATPTTAVGRGQAKVDGRGPWISGKQTVCDLKERIGATGKTGE